MIVTHLIVVHRYMVLVHIGRAHWAWHCDAVKIADHVVLDAAAVAPGGGTGAARIDSEVEVGHPPFVAYRRSVNLNVPLPSLQWQCQ